MNILIIGANSAIAKATARRFALPANNFHLVARNNEQLDITAADLTARGAKSVTTQAVDFLHDDACQAVFDSAVTALSRIDIVLMAHSLLGDQKDLESNIDNLMQLYKVNTLSSITLLTLLANHMTGQKSGSLVFIGSVAGDRGRPSNYVYGSSKACVMTFLQGLRARLAKYGVQVLTIKPGFVKTPMTEDFDRSGPLWVTPEMIAQGIEKGINKKRNTMYLPWFWLPIMTVIKSIPECIFKKLNL